MGKGSQLHHTALRVGFNISLKRGKTKEEEEEKRVMLFIT
jgi:hypothetical protein